MNPIYHIVPESEFKAGIAGNNYTPSRFEEDGFVHCTAGRETSLLVAKDYYSAFLGADAAPLLLLQIDTTKLTATVKFEAPAPIAGGGSEHLENETLFPHIYGTVNLDAVVGNGRLQPNNNHFLWPSTFPPLTINN